MLTNLIFLFIAVISMLRQETLTTISILAPNPLTFRHIQLAYNAFQVNSAQQFMVRLCWRWVGSTSCAFPNTSIVYKLSNGRPDGPYVIVRQDGTVYVRGYNINGMLHGVNQTWYRTGRLQNRIIYVCDRLQGVGLKWFESGLILEQYIYADGKRCHEYYGPGTAIPLMYQYIYSYDQPTDVSIH